MRRTTIYLHNAQVVLPNIDQILNIAEKELLQDKRKVKQ